MKRRLSTLCTSNQLPYRFPLIQQVLRATGLVRDGGHSRVDAKAVVERREDFLIVHRAVLRVSAAGG